MVSKSHIGTWGQVADCPIESMEQNQRWGRREEFCLQPKFSSPSKTAWKRWLYHYFLVWKNKFSPKSS